MAKHHEITQQAETKTMVSVRSGSNNAEFSMYQSIF